MEKIRIYTTQWCPDCHAAKRYLDAKGIEYEEVDIEKDAEGLKTVVAARGKRVVPTLEFNGRYMDGNHFNVERFAQDLKILLE